MPLLSFVFVHFYQRLHTFPSFLCASTQAHSLNILSPPQHTPAQGFKNCSLKSLWVFLVRLLAFSGVSWQFLHMMMQYPKIFQPTSMEFLEILQQEKKLFVVI